MNLKPQLPTSEITKTSLDEIQIEYNNQQNKLSYILKIAPFILVIPLLIINFSNLFREAFSYLIYGFGFILFLLQYVKSQFDSNHISIKKIIIGKRFLKAINQNSAIKQIQTPINQHIDFKVNVLENHVEVEYFDTIISLYETASLPVLLDGIANMHDFEFYDSTQLFDKSEVLTYKSKRVENPNFPSMLIIQNRNKNLKILDLLNQGNWIEFDFRKDEILRSNKELRDTFQIVISRIQKIEIFVFRGHKNMRKRILKVWITLGNGHKVNVFQTKNRSSGQELITVRDAKKVYQLLSENDNLKHIEIELKEF